MSQTVNFNNTTPAAPTGGQNVLWQNDNSAPPNISAYLPGIVSIPTYNSATQSQVVVSTTPYYITSSNLAVPNPAVNGLIVGSAFIWRVRLTKSAAGTGTFQAVIYLGTNGSTSDTAEVTQTIATQTGVADTLLLDVTAVWTAVGASTASFYWSICANQAQASGTGFGITNGTIASFDGTVGSLNSTTAGLIMGLGFISTTGTPTITVPSVVGNAYKVQ